MEIKIMNISCVLETNDFEISIWKYIWKYRAIWQELPPRFPHHSSTHSSPTPPRTPPPQAETQQRYFGIGWTGVTVKFLEQRKRMKTINDSYHL